LEQLFREAEALGAAAAANYRHAPRGYWDARHQVLHLEHRVGSHPRWDDADMHVWLARGIATDFKFVHGDITPWNTLKMIDGFLLLDWEFAAIGHSVAPVYDVLDFVIRGAIAAHARRDRVRRALSRLVQRELLSRAALLEGLSCYGEYRSQIRPQGDSWAVAGTAMATDLSGEI
jgi:hypothetical protein